jgi:hypothetical protein
MPHDKNDNYSEEGELEELREVAEKVFGIKFDTIVKSGSERNILGIRSEHILFSRRLDSRTYFVQDLRSRQGSDTEIFRGKDKVHNKMYRNILKGLRISLSEIDEEVIAREQTQVARVDYNTKEFYTEEVKEGKHIARVSRAVDKVPVWSSGIVLSLTQDGTIGYLQLHWPELPQHIVHEAHHLAYKIEHRWDVPTQPGAEIESLEAGIIHSPAMGFLMDIYPAVRVVYAPKDERYGQKPVYYYDRHGKSISIPRIADMPLEERKQRHSENTTTGPS